MTVANAKKNARLGLSFIRAFYEDDKGVVQPERLFPPSSNTLLFCSLLAQDYLDVKTFLDFFLENELRDFLLLSWDFPDNLFSPATKSFARKRNSVCSWRWSTFFIKASIKGTEFSFMHVLLIDEKLFDSIDRNPTLFDYKENHIRRLERKYSSLKVGRKAIRSRFIQASGNRRRKKKRKRRKFGCCRGGGKEGGLDIAGIKGRFFTVDRRETVVIVGSRGRAWPQLGESREEPKDEIHTLRVDWLGLKRGLARVSCSRHAFADPCLCPIGWRRDFGRFTISSQRLCPFFCFLPHLRALDSELHSSLSLCCFLSLSLSLLPFLSRYTESCFLCLQDIFLVLILFHSRTSGLERDNEPFVVACVREFFFRIYRN